MVIDRESGVFPGELIPQSVTWHQRTSTRPQSGTFKSETTVRVRIRIDDRPFWQRSSFLGENISNGNWIVALVLLLCCGGAIFAGWIWAGVALGIAGLLSIVWNAAVAKTATIVGVWIVTGVGSAWLLGMLCEAMFGSPALGFAAGLGVAITGVVMTID